MMFSDDIKQFILEKSPYNTIHPGSYDRTINGISRKITIRHVWIALHHFRDDAGLRLVSVFHAESATTIITCRYGHNPDYLFDETKTPTSYFEDISIVTMNEWNDPVAEVLKSFNAIDFIDSDGYIMIGNTSLSIRMSFKTLDGGDFTFKLATVH